MWFTGSKLEYCEKKTAYQITANHITFPIGLRKIAELWLAALFPCIVIAIGHVILSYKTRKEMEVSVNNDEI